jgi:SAM-dependent methyltransferase
LREVGRGLRAAEERLRAAGLTGAQAFDALELALRGRLGEAVGPVSEEARAAAELVPTDDPSAVLGLAYERFFADLFKGQRGQYFTPPPLVRLLLAHASVGPDTTVLDPACGSGGLLLAAARRGARVQGLELDPRLARLSSLCLRLAGVQGEVRAVDMFAEGAVEHPVDLVVANPPFSVPVHGTSSDRLFLQRLPQWVRPGGEAALVLPLSVAVNPRWADDRARLDEAFVRTRMLTLPEGVFRPFGGAAGRAVLLWLRRRPTQPVVPWFGTLSDPGYDPRSLALKHTSSDEVDARVHGEGFEPLPAGAWLPDAPTLRGRPVRELATVRRERAEAGASHQRLDLADVDRVVGEARPRPLDPGASLGGRWRIEAGDVLVSRMRPELGNVVVAPGAAVGSPEWVVLHAPERGGWLWLALRTAAWRAQLPLTGGQTRPRTTAEAVLDSQVPWSDDEALIDAVDREVRALLQRRAELAERLAGLQAAMEDFAEQGDPAVLEAALGYVAHEEAE